MKKITRAEDVLYFFHDKLKDKKQEEFWILMLNNQNIITKEELIFRGPLDSTVLHPREIFKPAIKNSSSKIILVHNHPSGDAFPSASDIKAAEKLKELGEKLGIKVVDHVIIGKENGWSCENNRRLYL